jgi:glutathione synthase/RimK-type ligase-like ATP-grasp enzyme
MRPRIALATYDRAPSLAPDDALLMPALAEAGIDAEPAVWSDETVIWETFDGIVIRSCWDYHLRFDEFRAWLERLDASRLPVFNSPALLYWNYNKRYLVDLAGRGVPTVETAIATSGIAPAAAAEQKGWQRFVIKPAVSASGYETHAFAAPLDDRNRSVIDRVAALGDVLVQPFVDEIQRDGEHSLVFIDGEFSHAAIKRAAGAEFRVQVEHGGSVDATDVSPELIARARRAIETLPEKPLYARVDGVVQGDAFLLMELELIEPNLFLELSADAPRRFANALSTRLRDV